jgi:casein kinase 1
MLVSGQNASNLKTQSVGDRMSLVNHKYRIVQELGQGTFGKVYQAVDPRDTHVAIKYDTSHLGMLQHEATMLNYLHQRQCHTKNIPKILWYGKSISPESNAIDVCGQRIECPCLVIPFYECTLSTYINNTSKNIRSLIIGDDPVENAIASLYLNRTMIQSMLSILEAIHQVYVIHRDLKPENFMLKGGQVYLIDFGLSTFFVDGDTGEHVPINTEPKRDLVGSSLYASIHVHRGYKASRRDDCIQLGYIWLYMAMGGRLPWGRSNHIVSDISTINIQHPVNQSRYCQKVNLPAKLDDDIYVSDPEAVEFQQIQNYLVQNYALEYDAKPNYKLNIK